jgi:hypothetical protein
VKKTQKKQWQSGKNIICNSGQRYCGNYLSRINLFKYLTQIK